MSFILKSGRTRIEYFPKKASTAISANALLSFYRELGQVAPVTSGSKILAGVSLRAVVSTDDDYASTTRIPVVVPSSDAVFEADTSSATAANVGNRYDLTDSLTVNLSGTTNKVVTVVGVISATKVLVKLNGAYEYINSSSSLTA